MLRFGVRGHDVAGDNFESWVDNIKDLGFCCTQLALKKAIKDFNVDREAMTPGMALYMKSVFEKKGVDVAVLGCYLNLATPDEEELKETLKTYMTNIRFAAHLNAGMVGTETGAINKEYKYEPANHSEEALQVFIERLKIVVKYAESMGVLFGIEPVWNHTMYDIKRTRQVLDAVNSPNLVVILDTVNLLNGDNYMKQDDIIKEAFELIKEEIAVLHIKDFVVEDGKVKSKPMSLGEGILNLPLLMSYAKKYKPCIHVLLEGSTPDNVKKSVEYMNKVYAEV